MELSGARHSGPNPRFSALKNLCFSKGPKMESLKYTKDLPQNHLTISGECSGQCSGNCLGKCSGYSKNNSKNHQNGALGCPQFRSRSSLFGIEKPLCFERPPQAPSGPPLGTPGPPLAPLGTFSGTFARMFRVEEMAHLSSPITGGGGVSP